jgi:putative ABC transport system ATP-binding protein
MMRKNAAHQQSTISVQNVSKKFYSGILEVEVLRAINLTVSSGDYLSIMGPSGSGKSTLLSLIGLLDEPTSGKILIDDIDTTKLSDSLASSIRREKLGFVFQSFNLIPSLTIRDNVLLPLYLRKAKFDVFETISSVLASVGLKEKQSAYPAELSGGQQQRVAIARALASDPSVILLDEPTGSLDSKNSADIMQLLSDLNKHSGITIIQVTHSHEVAAYGNRLCNMVDGELSEVSCEAK